MSRCRGIEEQRQRPVEHLKYAYILIKLKCTAVQCYKTFYGHFSGLSAYGSLKTKKKS